MGALLAAVLDGALAASDTAWDSAALDGTEDAAASEAEEASGYTAVEATSASSNTGYIIAIAVLALALIVVCIKAFRKKPETT